MKKALLFGGPNRKVRYNSHARPRYISFNTAMYQNGGDNLSYVRCREMLESSWMTGKHVQDVRLQNTEIPSWSFWWMFVVINCAWVIMRYLILILTHGRSFISSLIAYFFTFFGYITNSQYDKLPDGLIAQLVEHCTGIAEVICSYPVQAWIFSGFNFSTA